MSDPDRRRRLFIGAERFDPPRAFERTDKGERTMLNITKKIENASAVFTLEGRLDTVTAPELEVALKEVIDGLSELTLDCEKLEYISSAGLRVLLSAQKIMAKQGTMKVIHVNETIMEIFEVTGFSDILTIE
jgi:anti-sigma B factor antagonist